MNYEGENVIGVGWKEVASGKASPLVVVYCGNDVELAADAVTAALESGTIHFGRVYRGPLFAGQPTFVASKEHPPAAPSVVYPATGR